MKGYDKIGQYGQEVFEKTHKKHLVSMGTGIRAFYERDQVESIKANNKEMCLEVRFKCGALFKYTPELTWH